MSTRKSARAQAQASTSPSMSRKDTATSASNAPTEVEEPVNTVTSAAVKEIPNGTKRVGYAKAAGEAVNGNGDASPDVMEISQVERGSVTELLIRHLHDDINAYEYDRQYCTEQLRGEGSLSGQEVRTLRLRMLDLGHHIRLTNHKMELLTAMGRYEQEPPNIATIINGLNSITSFSPINGSGHPLSIANPDSPNYALLHQASSASPPVLGKRSRKTDETEGASTVKKGKHATIKISDLEEDPGNTVQRLGFWKCRLCASPKYLGAGPGRQPSAPCKWPLRDVSKMMVHFAVMHQEHTPAERCSELGDALSQNRGPFEYWLRHSRSMDLGDGSIIDDVISALQSGTLPNILRRLSKAASQFPEEGEE